MSSDVLRVELERVARALGDGDIDFVLERPRDDTHGDLATNLALTLAKRRRSNPRAVAEEVLRELQAPASLIRKTEIAGPGFINFWLASDTLAALHARILAEGARYGRSTAGEGLKVNLEFVSANPTGPLHVGHGRGAALGDAIASLLEWSGHAVTREFYINDAGVQIDRLAQSLWARVQQGVGRDAAIPDGGYHGLYLQENAAMKPVFEAWMEAVKDLGATRISMRNTGGTDHQSFDGAGLPGFQFIQDPIEYMDGNFFGTHHTDMDVYDRLQREDLMQAAVVIASFAYDAAMRDELLPRKPLPPVAAPAAPVPAAGKAGTKGGAKPAPKALEAAPGAAGER